MLFYKVVQSTYKVVGIAVLIAVLFLRHEDNIIIIFLKLENIYANIDNFTSDVGMKVRKKLNPIFRKLLKIINEEENICIMINEEDHLRIQVLGAGFDIDNLMKTYVNWKEKYT